MLSQLQLDLRELSQEARKKEAELKEASENATLLVRTLAEKTKDMNEQVKRTSPDRFLSHKLSKNLASYLPELQTMDDVLKPFLLGLGLSGSSQKIGLISISGINKLISYHAIHEVDSGAMNDMTSLLKVMQTIVAMLTPPSPPIHADDLAKALGLCFKMHASKTPGLHQPSEASLRQIFSTIMDTTWSLYSKQQQQQQQQQSQSDPSSSSQQSVTSSTTDSSSDPSSSSESSSSLVLSYSSTSTLSNVQQDSSHVVSTKQKQSECDRSILDATRLLRDIVYLAGGNQPIWLSVTSLDPNFCLELIEEFLTTHKHLALQCPKFMSIVKDRIGVLLLQLLEHRRDIGFMIRLLRTCVAFMTTFHLQQSMNCVTILGAFKSYLLPTQPFWLQVLVLEAFKWLCKDGEALFSQLIEKDDSALKEKPQLLEAFMKLIGKLGRYVTTSIAKLDPQEFVAKTMKPRFIDQLTYTDISGQMAPSHAISLSLSCFVTLIDALAHLVTPFGLTSGSATASPPGIESPLVKTDSSSSISSQRSSTSLDVPSSLAKNPATSTSLPPTQEHLDALFQACQKVCDASWPSVLASLSVILSKTRDDSLIHSSLKAYQSFTNTLGLLKLSGPRGALLESLVKFALPFGSSLSPANSSSAGVTTASSTIITTLLSEEEYRNCRFTKKNIAAMKTVLNVAHCMGSILDTNWTIMVETLNHLNGILACTRRVRNVGVITGVISSPSDDDLSFSSSSVDSIGSSGGVNSKGKPSYGAISQYELNTQDASLAAQEWPTREEIDILDSALESLFSTSIYISDTGLVDFANSLISMSNAQLEAITENMNVRPHALYGPTALLKLARNNLHRASLIWTSIHKHILEACSSPNHFTRQFVLKSACSAIEEGVHAISKPPYDSLAKDDPSFVSMMLMQVRFLETIEALVECRYDHVRIETLESMHRILQNSGVALNSGWHVVLAILLNIGVSNEISLIPLGFKSVQSITNEYLSALPFECLPVTISTIGNFGGKSIADININIAAIGLLWNVADFIARKQHDILKELHSAGEDVTTPSRPDTPLVGSPSEVPFRHNDAQFSAGSGGLYKGQATYVDSLWLALFQELAARVDNLRCEIRDCALATLYGILTTYGSSLNLPAWQNLLEKLLLPSFPWVLKQVEAAGRAIDDAETQQSMISTTNLQQSTTTTSTVKTTQPPSGGHPSTIHRNNSQTSPHLSANSAAQIVIHPARNTLVKQWQETQVSLLANMSRVFKAFLKSALVKLPISTLERCYTTFLDHAEIFAKSSNLDVAQQAVSSVRELLVATYNFFEDFKPSSANEAVSSPFNGTSLPDPCIQLTNHAWRTWQRIANSIGKNRQQARLVGHFVEGIEELHAVLQRKNCDSIHIQRILSVLEPLLYLPLELAGEYTVLHRQVFPLLSSLILPSHCPKAAAMISPGSNTTTSAANGSTSLALQSKHALEIVPQVVSICLTYISNAIGFQYNPACYTPESPALRHQLDLPNLKPSEATVITTPPSALSIPPSPHPSPPPTSSPFVVDRGSWNVSQASLEKNFFNLADKSVRLLVALWECLVKRDYILQQPPSSDSTESDSTSLSTDQEFENQRVEAECLRLSIQVFPDLASVLGYAIQVRNLDNRAKFWTPCLELFTSVVREALPWLSPESSSSAASSSNSIDSSTTTTPALESSTVANKKTFSNIDKNIIWTGVIDSIESFLMASVDGSNTLSVPSSASLHHPMMGMPPSPAPDSPEAIAAQASEARLIELLTSHLIYICPNLPNLHDRLFQILTDGCELNQRESMMKQCYSGLFDTVHQVSFMDQTTSTPLQGNPFKTRENCIRVARLAFPQLMRRCRGVISKFVADDKRSGALPLPSSRISEISFVLEQLRTLRVDSSLWDKPPKVAHLATSQIRHLWELFPLLCECITAKETTVKLLVKSLFLECGLELGLE